MRIGNFAGEYHSKTDEEVLLLALDFDHLTTEAQAKLTSEFAKRGISAKQIGAFREQEQLRRAGIFKKSEPVVSLPMDLESNSYAIGSPLSSKTPKAPWRPTTAGRIAFFFGPVAGALVIAISLRRMGYQQYAKKVVRLAVGGAAALAAILFFVPDGLSRLLGIGAEIAFLLTFPSFMEKEFSEWESSHPSVVPSNGWNAIGWGLVGIALFLVIGFFVFLGLGVLLPAYQ